MKMKGWWFLAALLVAAAGAVGAGCTRDVNNGSDGDAGADGDSDTDSDADTDADSDADADADADADTVRVHVYTQDRQGSRANAGGALVAFDRPDGTRVEQTADAEGVTTFTDVDWSSGEPGAVIAYLADWQLGGNIAMSEAYVRAKLEADGELMVVLGNDPNSDRGLVEVSGTASILARSDILTVEPSTQGLGFQQSQFLDSTPEYSVMVPPDERFSLVAIEWLYSRATSNLLDQPAAAWAIVDHAEISEPTTIDIDLAQSVEPVSFSGSLEVPADTVGTHFQRSFPYVVVQARAGFGLFSWGSGSLGGPTGIDGADAPTWTYEGEYVTTDAVPDVVTAYYWWRQAWEKARTSRVIVPGVPGDSPPSSAFPEPIAVDNDPYTIGDTLEWAVGDRDAADPTLEVLVVVLGPGLPASQPVVATLFAPVGTKSARIPAPPSDAADAFTPTTHGRIDLCELDPDRRVCMRLAMGLQFEIAP